MKLIGEKYLEAIKTDQEEIKVEQFMNHINKSR